MDLLESTPFAERVNELLNQWHVPGLAIALVEHDKIRSKGFGHASLNPPRLCSPDTLFDLCSASKSLTAASVGLLCAADEKYPNIHWDSTVSSLLPDDFVCSQAKYTDEITVEDCLSHRTGYPRHDDSYFGVRSAQPDTPRSVTRNLRDLEPSAPLRTNFKYNNLMYTIMTHLVETASGLSFAEYLSENFFNPLGMNRTYLQPDTVVAAGLKDQMATPYTWDQEKEAYKVTEYEQCPEAQGAGSIFSSANDYLKWVQALMNKTPPITGDIYKELTRPRSFSDEEPGPLSSDILYAAGLQVMNYRGHQIVWHDGCISGFGSTHFFLPSWQFGGVLLGNADGADTVISVVMRELIDEVLKTPGKERTDWNKRAMDTAAKAEEEEEGRLEKIKQELRPEGGGDEPQTTPLSAYAGEYWNAGYRGLKVEVKDEELHVDASDRTGGFYLSFEHVCDQTKYIAHLTGKLHGESFAMKAEFKLKNQVAVRLGIDLEEDLHFLIWFDRIGS